MKRRFFILLVAAYVSAPLFAGLLAIGERAGPMIYPGPIHSILYGIAFEWYHAEKPREAPDDWMYHRPYFYGFDRRLKAADERDAYIEMARRNGSPRTQRLLEMNEAVNRAKEKGGNEIPPFVE
jgi:hypothetical protein